MHHKRPGRRLFVQNVHALEIIESHSSDYIMYTTSFHEWLVCRGVQEEYRIATSLLYYNARMVFPVTFHDFEDRIPIQLRGMESFQLDARSSEREAAKWGGLKDLERALCSGAAPQRLPQEDAL